MLDFICSVLGIIYSSTCELIFQKNLLFLREKPRKQILNWYFLIFFRKNFKSFVKHLGLDPWKYPEISDLKKVRLTDKSDISNFFPEDSLSRILKFLSLKMTSSGSTGSPFVFKFLFYNGLKNRLECTQVLNLVAIGLERKWLYLDHIAQNLMRKILK